MGLVKVAVGDGVLTFLWVFCASCLGAATSAIAKAIGIQGMASLLITVSLIFILLFIFGVIGAVLGGASFNPTGTAAFYALGIGGDSLISTAVRFPAQAVGAVGGVLAVLEFMPLEYKHMLGGPSLQVDMHTGAIAETILTFTSTMFVLYIILRGPKSILVKNWLLSVSMMGLVFFGRGYTGPSMNPANAFGWAYVNNQHYTWEQFYVYWISPFVGAISAAWIFRFLFPPPSKENSHQSVKPPSAAAAGNGQIRYRSPSAAELLEGQVFPSPPLPDQLDKMIKRRQPQYNDSLADKMHRYRGIILVVSIPLLLISFVLFLMPSVRSPTDGVLPANRKFSPNYMMKSDPSSNRYAVIFDAGSSGSRVHVFCFDKNLDLVRIGNELELFEQLKPGLSAHATDPKEAADSLLPLLEKAEKVVPQDMLQNTPVKVGATAGLRQLGVDASERILQAVKDVLKVKSSLKSNDDWVTVLDGTQEGAYQWVTINYLLKKLGQKYSQTVGVVDLGGGSVQMAYAISEADAAKAPRITNGEDTYVKEMFLMGTKYYLYVHSYLKYGLLAARAEILGIEKDSDNPCILAGYNGVYKYAGTEYKVSALPSGSSFNKCREQARKSLRVNESTCTHMKCTFGGVWNGGGGDGQKNLFVASFFFDRAAQAGFVDVKKPVAKVSPRDFQVAAQSVCQTTTLEDAKSQYPDVDPADLPYLCMDLVYQYTLLVDGFDLQPKQQITLVKQVEYQNLLVEAAWPLGSAIEAVSATG
ncbi:hypothetical protein SSX86_000851 [Deinandra increscens subsp. villosa]|uniref:Apyrase n=1 Tax=Deinandra increscens subsp. villosa TaxID=3103831 RepID=A0AAP0DQ71_9ASTR